MKFELDSYNHGASDEQLLADIQHVAASTKKQSVTRKDQDRLGRFKSSTSIRRFTTWANACKQAGLKMTQTQPNISEEELFRNLEQVWIKLGRQPRYAEVTTVGSKYSVDTYAKRFKGWRNALKAFVNYANSANSSPDGRSEEPNNEDTRTQLGSRHVNSRLMIRVLIRDKSKCRLCGRSPEIDESIVLHIDHIRPWSKGGPTVLENLQALCSRCNIGKSNLEFANASTPEVKND